MRRFRPGTHPRAEGPPGDYYLNFQDPGGEPATDPLVVDGKTYLKIGAADYSQADGYGWYSPPEAHWMTAWLGSGPNLGDVTLSYWRGFSLKSIVVPGPSPLYAASDPITVSTSYDLTENQAGPAICDAGAICDAVAHRQTWHDMLRLQEAGVYPALLAAIRAPVLMVHGAADPHPGPMIRDGLVPYLPQLEYHEWARCGHYPWLERAVGAEFFALVGDWLVQRSGGTLHPGRVRP